MINLHCIKIKCNYNSLVEMRFQFIDAITAIKTASYGKEKKKNLIFYETLRIYFKIHCF